MRKTLALAPALAWGQTTEELYNDGKNPDNVLTQSMGFARSSYSPLAQINKTNIERLVPIWSASLMNDAGELAAPVVYDGVVPSSQMDLRDQRRDRPPSLAHARAVRTG